MLDKDTLDLLEKIAQDDATGSSQMKQRSVKTKKYHAAEGAGLGAILGAGAGALSKKYKPLTTAAGAVLGGLAGKDFGKHLYNKTKTVTNEGTIKKQQKSKAPGAKAEVPQLREDRLMKLLTQDK